jgi:hypothetical protein
MKKVVIGAIILLSLIPIAEVFFVVGNEWQGFPPSFADEGFYYAHVLTIAEGYFNDGNPYFFEHRFDPPLVIFAGAWINAIPLILGVPLIPALLFNFFLWGLLFAATAYLLFREFSVPPWWSVGGVVMLYLLNFSHILRPANLQPVYPFYFLFYLALARLLREPNRKNILLLAFVSGISGYLFSYLLQAVAVTLTLLIVYAVVRRDWVLSRAALLASVIGGILGLPPVLYTFWLSHHSPYFWESIARFGLVHTHIPMAEIIYSGGWIGLLLAFIAGLYWLAPQIRTPEFRRLFIFALLSGMGLWITQGSNLFTGILVETGEHVRVLILPWILFTTLILGAYLWRERHNFSVPIRALAALGVGLFAIVSVNYTYLYYMPIVAITDTRREAWAEEERFMKPYTWLEQEEKNPVVVLSDPHTPITDNLAIYTRHFTVFSTLGMWHLVPEGELRERYLLSQYFNKPTASDLEADMATYLGRQTVFHIAKTDERRIKICRLMSFVTGKKDCGTPMTSAQLLGQSFFTDLESKLSTDIRPHIKEYLKKYHVSYILKDVVHNPGWHPEELGAKRVYSDGSYEIYRL